MARKLPEFVKIEGDGSIPFQFQFLLQNGLLLALHERGTINAMQLRYAQEKLKQRRRDRAKDLLDSREKAQ